MKKELTENVKSINIFDIKKENLNKILKKKI